MRVIIKPAGFFLLIAVIAALSSLAFFGTPRARTAAVVPDHLAKAETSAATADLYARGTWKLGLNVPEAAKMTVHTGAVPGVGEPIPIYTIVVKKVVPNPWDVALNLPTPAATTKNEKLRLTFRARSVDAVPFTANFEQNSTPYPKFGSLNVSTTPTWNLYTLEFASKNDYAPEKSQTTFHLATKPGTIEIADIHLYRVAK